MKSPAMARITVESELSTLEVLFLLGLPILIILLFFAVVTIGSALPDPQAAQPPFPFIRD